MNRFETIINHDGTLLYQATYDQKYDLKQLLEGIVWRNDHMSRHSDNEKSLGINPTIASLSYGVESIFQLKHVHQL